ncbi:serine/threonine-protein kinase 17A-like isoform X1 [Lingula anatina]|uniref:non-specific serine/threonine protein kinase n=2 Tax=Lingula anatina TaxID=7574 RepID=A0A1S3HRL9_LINAN|nr:serine/threonine-protein kinase 17A-like isoform X1 [Lingula anatina]|eukprot:XP_013388196.1 serine/threonine-protein kinase 17A-like isoform X1 [Lingula anatina]
MNSVELNNILDRLLNLRMMPAGEHKLNCDIRQEPLTERFTIEGEIGRGKFAVVRKIRDNHSGQEYAAKYIRKRRKGKDVRSEILHEVVMLEMALAHPRLIDLKEVYETSHELVLITEYAAGGELFHHIDEEESFKEKEVIHLMRQIMEGLVFLHDRNVVHLDLKPQNILLTNPHPHGDVKLCDFGFARLVNYGEDIRDIIGTPDYVAPEVLSYEPIGTYTDIWSVGVLVYVMLTGCSPFAGEDKQETFLNISQVNLDFPEDLFCDISENAIDFISKCLVRQPGERISARDCLQHSWLKVEVPTSPALLRSPLGSPIGCRRTHPPESPHKKQDLGTPKKFKYNTGESKICPNEEHSSNIYKDENSEPNTDTCNATGSNITSTSNNSNSGSETTQQCTVNNNINKLPELTEEQLVC